MPNSQDNIPQYAFVIGAAKTGTTALIDMLNNHSDICVSSPKETDYFTNEGIKKDVAWFENCFNKKPYAPVRVEASVSNSAGWGGSSSNIASRIKAFSPDAKIIYVVRDPIDRTWSAYWHAKRSGYEDKSFSESVKNTAIDHIQGSKYFARLTDYREHFDKNNIMVIHQSQIKNNTQVLLNDLCAWLKVPTFELSDKQLSSQVNATYQFSTMGLIIHKLLPIKKVKALGVLCRKYLPIKLVNMIRNIYSKPIPSMSTDDALYLKDLYTEDVDSLHREYGIDVKTSRWWNR